MTNQSRFKDKVWPFLSGMGSAMIMILAFFIPSLQDQWDKHKAREVVEQYEQIGDEFFDEEKYDLAEKSFAKAYELSLNLRLDIEIKRLNAKINSISVNPVWGSKPPEELEDADFQFLLHMLKGKENDKKRTTVLNSYGVFLAESGRLSEAHHAFEDALNTDSTDERIYINLGNLLNQLGNKPAAEKMYLKAVAIDNVNVRAHYNLGLLYATQGKNKEAIKEFEQTIAIDSTDKDAKIQYEILTHKTL